MKTRKTLGKRMLSILLTAIIVMSTMPMSVFADDSTTTEGGGVYVPPGSPNGRRGAVSIFREKMRGRRSGVIQRGLNRSAEDTMGRGTEVR